MPAPLASLAYDPIAYEYYAQNTAAPPPAPVEDPYGTGQSYAPTQSSDAAYGYGTPAPAPAPATLPSMTPTAPVQTAYGTPNAGGDPFAAYGSSAPPPASPSMAGPASTEQIAPAYSESQYVTSTYPASGAPLTVRNTQQAPPSGAPAETWNQRAISGTTSQPFAQGSPPADRRYDALERNRAGIEGLQTQPALNTYKKPETIGGWNTGGYLPPDDVDSLLPPPYGTGIAPSSGLEGAINGLGTGVSDAVSGLLGWGAEDTEAKAISQRDPGGGGGPAGGVGSGPVYDAKFTVKPSAGAPAAPPASGMSLSPLLKAAGALGAGGLLAGAEGGRMPYKTTDTGRDLREIEPPADPFSLLPDDDASGVTALPRFTANARGQYDAPYQGKGDSLTDSYRDGGQGPEKPFAPEPSGDASEGPLLNTWADRLGLRVREQEHAAKVSDPAYIKTLEPGGPPIKNVVSPRTRQPFVPDDPSKVKSDEAGETPLEKALQTAGQDVDAQGFFTDINNEANPKYVTNGVWNQDAATKGIIAPDAVGKKPHLYHLTAVQRGTPLERGAAAPEVAAAPAVNSGAVSESSGNAGGGGDSGWVEYGSRRGSGGGGGYSRNSGGGGFSRSSRGGSFGGSSRGDSGISDRWEDYAEDLDGDGKFNAREMMLAKKKMMAAKRKGRTKGMKNLPSIPTSPIRQQILGNLSSAFGREVGGWPEGL
jgi:hypothetical protein